MNGKKEKYLVAALKFVERGQLDKALAEFAKVVAEDPGDTRTWLKMAELQARLGANAEATEIYLRTGELYTEQGFAQKAVAVYKNALRLTPGSAQAHLKLGALFKQLGLVSDAVQQFELGAGVLQRQNVPAEAAAAFRQALAAQPENVVLRVKLAEAASLGGLVEEAVREFGRAADQLKAQGRVDESLRVLERLLFHQPNNATKARELAEAYIAKGNPRLALPKLQACLNAAPGEPRTLSLLARALEQLGQVDKAVSVLKELARLCHELGRGGERDAAINRALALLPHDPETQALALRHQVQGNAAPTGGAATPPPVSVAEVEGGGSFDLSGLVRVQDGGGASGRVSVPLGVGDTSARVIASAAGGGPDAARILAESEVFVKYGLLERAVDHLGRVFDFDPDNREAREKLSSVLQKLGRREEAARHLEILAHQQAHPRQGAAGPEAPRAATNGSAPPRSLPQTALDVDDDDPVIDVATPLPERDPGVTPAPLSVESERSTDRVVFEQDVLTGDVVAVTDVGRRTVSLDWDEGANQATPPPVVRTGEHHGSAGAVAEMMTPPPLVASKPGAAQRPPVDPWVGKATPPPQTFVDDEDLAADLEQVAFFLDQGIAEEARALLTDLRRRYPHERRVAAKLREVETLEARQAEAELLGTVPQAGNTRRGADATPPPRVVVEGGDAADVSTHLDLAIAYKEMGLFDAAITELKIVTDDPDHEVFALTMMGECFEAKGSFTEAVIRYKEALNCTPISADETMQLYFLLGGAFDRLGDASEALYFFDKVARREPKFRDVHQRIAALRPRLAKTAP
ncbi:MAG TPA: tetratricopeptide repeat protein [Polyangia bacterium]